MKVNLKKIGGLVLGIVGAVVPAVGRVEAGIKKLKDAKGQAKQDAALELVKGTVELVEQLGDKDVLNDPEVEKATRGVIDAIVALQNVLVKKQQQ